MYVLAINLYSTTFQLCTLPSVHVCYMYIASPLQFFLGATQYENWSLLWHEPSRELLHPPELHGEEAVCCSAIIISRVLLKQVHKVIDLCVCCPYTCIGWQDV